MKKAFLLSVSAILICNLLQAQLSRYLVEFTNKGGTAGTIAGPSSYLSQAAIDRRTRYQIPVDSTDLPVPASFITQLQAIPNVTVINVSNWLNAAAIQTTDADALAAINALPFVKSSRAIAARTGRVKAAEATFPAPVSAARGEGVEDYFDYGTTSFNEIHLHQGEFLHNVGLRGQGMQIAILDGGFFSYNTLRSFDSANANGQILSTWDFVAGNASVAEDNTHGMQCLSTIVANIPGQFIGKAPKASFHLFRTEDVNSEYPIEEFNWACGAQRADSVGADVISSSLGYGYEFDGGIPDYPHTDLDGNTTLSARAADLAAKKGLMVFNAAGNSGNDYWHYITTPSDGDSVLAIGAVSSAGVVASFSSYGPSTDGRVKPDISSVGVSALIQGSGNNIISGNGTSYACPNMAGLGTCLWQGFREFNNMRIVRALKEAGSIYSSPDTRIGYGIPDMKKAFLALLADYATTGNDGSVCNPEITWASKDVAAMKYIVQRKTSADADYVDLREVPAQGGIILTNESYHFIDDLLNVAEGSVSYRVVQVVDTSSATYTTLQLGQPQVIDHSQSCDPVSNGYFIAPNPATSSAALVINSNNVIAKLGIVVYDMKGSRVYAILDAKNSAGTYRRELPVSRLAKGRYIVRIYDGKKALKTLDLLKL